MNGISLKMSSGMQHAVGLSHQAANWQLPCKEDALTLSELMKSNSMQTNPSCRSLIKLQWPRSSGGGKVVMHAFREQSMRSTPCQSLSLL